MRPSHLMALLVIVALALCILDLGAYLICNIVGFLFPAYKSFKALRTNDTTDDKKWLTYWVVFSFFTVFDGVISSILFFIPYFSIIKLSFYVYLFHPKSDGAKWVYDNFLEKMLAKYEGKIDKNLEKGGKIINNIAE